jgi:hypothetical protein
MVIREAHLLDLPTCVFFTRCWIWIVQWDNHVAHLLLLLSRVHVYWINIKSILCKAFVCRGPIKYKNTNAVRMGVLEDCNHMFDLFNQLLQILPCIKPFAWVDYLSCFKLGKVELRWKLELHANLLLG